MPAATIQFNGKPFEIPEGSSITDLLRLADIRTELVAVERNMELVPRRRHADTILCEGDAVEVVTLVGGG
ncbi:MAG: sulfur carrier protein ThiS [Pirellulales bacterium]